MTFLRSSQQPVANAFAGTNLRNTIIEYRNAVGAIPTDPEQCNTLGDLYVRAGRIDDAVACFSRAADTYRRNGSTLRAIAVLKKICRLCPGEADFSIKLGDLLVTQGLHAEARLNYLSAGDNNYISGDSDGAIRAYEKVISIAGPDAALLSMLGSLYMETGLLRQAHAALSGARKEHLKMQRFGLAREASSRARTLEGVARVDYVSTNLDRRREERFPVRLGTIVLSQSHRWKEFTQTINISKSGLRFPLSRPLEPDTILRLQLPVPSELKLNTSDNEQYATDAIVCNCVQTGTGHWIGAEFGSLAPVAAS